MSSPSGTLSDRIAAMLRQLLPPDTIVDVSASGVRDNLHVLVVSRKLDKMSERQKQEYLWGMLEEAVKKTELTQQELDRVSLVLPVSVDELRR